jgi:hypothetical protein
VLYPEETAKEASLNLLRLPNRDAHGSSLEIRITLKIYIKRLEI